MKPHLILIVTLASAALSACDTPRTPLAESFGEAVSRNMAAQIVNPQGISPDKVPGQDGARVARANTRLITEKKQQPTVQFPGFIIQQQGAK